MPRRLEKQSSGRRGWRSRSRSRGRRNSNGDNNNNNVQEYNNDPMDYDVVNAADGGSGGMNVNSTVTGATGQEMNYTYMTSPPPQRSKGGLTGNISSLFRKASRRGGGGSHDTGSLPNDPTSSSAGGYAGPASPRITSHTSDAAPSSPRFLQSAARRSTTASAAAPSAANVPNQAGKHKHRLFYSNADDDDSQDSFETRTRSGLSNDRSSSGQHNYGRYATRAASPATIGTTSVGGANSSSVGADTYGTSTIGYTYTTAGTEYTEGSSSFDPSHRRDGGAAAAGVGGGVGPSTTILRYRGFSTSIKSLFLDEALVCASMGCFGLILSNRTEYLLQLRNDRRGVQWGRSSSRRTLPSRIVAYALLLTLLLCGITFVVWGFGSDNGGNPFANTWYNSGGGSSSGSSSKSSSNGGSSSKKLGRWLGC